MGIDLRSFIEDDKAIKLGGYSGSIFLTYTLNLNFYEQIIAPALDQAGCANVLIISDPDGYAEAIHMGYKTVNGVGMRYVCEPLLRIGQGIQHAKMLFMAGPNCGRLLIGSGNLTYHGYGRNLELYSGFDFNVREPDLISLYAFQKSWELIQKIKAKRILPPIAIERIRIIEDNVSWLLQPVNEVSDFRIWHNVEQPIWSQLQDWRDQMGFSSDWAQKIIVISPFFDKDIGTIKKIASDLVPNQIDVIVDPLYTNLNGVKLKFGLHDYRLKLMGIENRITENQSAQKRPLHAKAIIGIEQNCSWCLTGSANITRPALMERWNTSGNLEMVTFRWSENKNAFSYLTEDPAIQIWQIDDNSLNETIEGPSDQPNQITNSFFLEYVIVRGVELSGKVNINSKINSQAAEVRFLRSGSTYQTIVDYDGGFHLSLPSPLNEAEALQLGINGVRTPYRWIDQPEVLARFGARSYHERIQRKIETFDGAGRLFEELLNFLWERTDPELIQEHQADHNPFRRRREKQDDAEQEVPPAPPPNDFIISENDLLERINKRVSHHLPYDRSTWSLRDLLSLVLLRLTTPIQPADKISETDKDDDSSQITDLDKEQREALSRKRLRDFVIQYCRKYGTRLVDNDFIQSVAPTVIFENHFTLGRVLIELASKGEQFPEFTHQDFKACTWWLWAPLVWPAILGVGGKPSLSQLVSRFPVEDIQGQWNGKDLSSLLIVMLNLAFGKPPAWKEGIWSPNLASVHLAIKQLVLRFENYLKVQYLDLSVNGIIEALGIRSTDELENNQSFVSRKNLLSFESYLQAIKLYRSPVEERLAPIIEIYMNKVVDIDKIETLRLIADEHGIGNDFKAFLQNPKRISSVSTKEDDEGEVYCVCGGSLTKEAVNRLKRGELVLCTSSRDAWLFQKIPLPQRVV